MIWVKWLIENGRLWENEIFIRCLDSELAFIAVEPLSLNLSLQLSCSRCAARAAVPLDLGIIPTPSNLQRQPSAQPVHSR